MMDDAERWITAVNTLAGGYRNAGTAEPGPATIRMVGPSGEITLREWPDGTAPAHVEAIGQVLSAMHHATNGRIPSLQSTVVDGRVFSRSEFIPGFPLGRYGGFTDPDGKPIHLPLPESASIRDVAGDIAGLLAAAHEASTSISTPNVLARRPLASVLADVRKQWFDGKKTLGERAAEQRDIRRWLRCGNRIIPTASDLLQNAEVELHDTSVVAHTDLWPVDVIVDHGEVAGIVGWRNMTATSPVLDVAALTTHLQGWSAALTEHIVERYATVRRLAPQERRIVAPFAALDLVEQVRRLLVLNYLDERMLAHEALPVVRSGMKTLLNSLETLTSMLAPDIDQTKRFAKGKQFDRSTKATGPARPRQARMRPSDQRPNRPGRQRKDHE